MFQKDERGGIDPYIAFIVSLTASMVALIFFVEALVIPRTQTTLQNAAAMLARSESINGCVTSDTQKAVDSYLLDNQLDPQKVFFSPPPSSQVSYGTDIGSASQPAVTLGYDLDVFSLSPSKTDPLYIQSKAVINKSSYTPNGSASSADCANLGLFLGTQGGSDSGTSPGTGNTDVPTAGSISANVPSLATAGSVANITGQTDLPNAQVSIFGAGFSATTIADGSGNFSFPAIFTLAGADQVVTVSSGSASHVYTITVNADPVGSVQFTAPAPNTIPIGQPFAISGTAKDTKGNPLPDGTVLSLTSDDPTDIPTQTVSTVGGQFSIMVANGITQNLKTVTISETDTTPATTYSIDVTPAQPKSVTVSANPSTVVAGNPVVISGTVDTYGGMAVQDGTPVTLTLGTVTLGTAVTTNGGFSLTIPSSDLTRAGTNAITATTSNNIAGSTTILVSPGTPAQISGLSGVPNPVSPGANTAVTGVVEDQYGNPVNQNYSIVVDGTSESCDIHGVLSFSWSFNSSGLKTLDFDYGGAVIGSLDINVNATTNGLRLTPIQSTYTITAGKSVTGVQFKITDSNGDPVSGDAISFEGQSLATDSSGIAGPFNTPVLTAAGSQTLTATVPTVPGLEGTVGVVVNPAAASQFQGGTISPNPMVVQTTTSAGGIVTDQYGNPVTGDSIVVSGGYGASSSPVVVGQSGIPGYASVVLDGTNVGGPYPLTVTDTITGTVLASSLSITVKPPSGATLSLAPTDSASIVDLNTGFGVTASLVDSTGAAIPNVPITFSVSPDSSAAFNSNPKDTNNSGEVSDTVTFNQSGSQIVTATATANGQTLQTSIYLYVTTPLLGSISWQTVSPNPVNAGSNLMVSGQALDITGNPVPNTQIQLYFKEGGAGVQTVYTNGNGYFSATFVPTAAGQRTLMAQIGNVVIQYPTPITVSPGPPVSGTVSFNYTPPLLTNDTFTAVVHLVDIDGNSVPNYPVTINLTGAFVNTPTYHPATCSDGTTPTFEVWYGGDGYVCTSGATVISGYTTYQFPETVYTDANGNASFTGINTSTTTGGTINVTATAGTLTLTGSTYATQAVPITASIGNVVETGWNNANVDFNTYDQKGRFVTAQGTMSATGYNFNDSYVESYTVYADGKCLANEYYSYGQQFQNTPQQINSGTVNTSISAWDLAPDMQGTNQINLTYVVNGITLRINLYWTDNWGTPSFNYNTN